MRPIPPGLVPQQIENDYEIHNWRNAVQLLATAYPAEWEDVLNVLGGFTLRKSHVLAPGGSKTEITKYFEDQFTITCGGWEEREVTWNTTVDGVVRESSTHKIDCFRNNVGIEIEWNRGPNLRPLFEHISHSV